MGHNIFVTTVFVTKIFVARIFVTKFVKSFSMVNVVLFCETLIFRSED